MSQAKAALIISLLVVFAFGQPSQQANTTKLSINVVTSGDDALGAAFALAVKERIASSSIYELASTGGAFTISIITMPAAPPPLDTAASAVGWVLTAPMRDCESCSAYNRLLYNGIMVVGYQRVDDSAGSLLGLADSAIAIFLHRSSQLIPAMR